MRFTGSINAKLDAKGRVFFPAVFRRQLAEGEVELIVRKDVYQPCLVVYPQSVWDEELRRLRQSLNHWDPKEAMVFRQFMAEAESVPLDASGRILLSKRMLRMAGIDREMFFLGMDDRIEIWSCEQMEKPFLSSEELGSALLRLMTSGPRV